MSDNATGVSRRALLGGLAAAAGVFASPAATPDVPRRLGEGGREALHDWGIGFDTVDELVAISVKE